MAERLPSKMLKIATYFPNVTHKQNTLILNYDGTPMQHVFQAPMIRLLAKGLGVTFNIVIPEDKKFGSLKPDGKSTGMSGMIERGEVDLSAGGYTMTEKSLKAFPYTYPLYITYSTFMTNKLEPYPKRSAIFDVFSFEVWLIIGLCLILVSLVLYFLLKRRQKFSTILLQSIGCLLEQSFSFEARQRNTALLLLLWFIGVAILTASYKSVILSIMTAPMMVGIRYITDLSKAAKENSIKCFTWGRTWDSDLSLIIIDDCINKRYSEGLYGIKAFHNYPYKKVFLAERVEIEKYHRYYYVSDDSFQKFFIGIPYSRNFCCPKKLERVIHRIVAAGLYEKTIKDEDFIEQLHRPKETGIADDNIGVLPLKLEDLIGAFAALFVGHLCSFFVLIAEIVHKKWQHLFSF